MTITDEQLLAGATFALAGAVVILAIAIFFGLLGVTEGIMSTANIAQQIGRSIIEAIP